MHCPFFLDKICIALSLEAVCSLCSESILCESKRNSLMCCDKVLFHFYPPQKEKLLGLHVFFPLPPKVNSLPPIRKNCTVSFLRSIFWHWVYFSKGNSFPPFFIFHMLEISWIANGYLIPNSLCLRAVTLEMEPGKCGRKPLIVGF